jgi:Zn-dependent metalloprotease
MKRLLPLLFALSVVAVYFPRVDAQRPLLFTIGTPEEVSRARALGLERLRANALQKGMDGPNDLVVAGAHVDRRSMAHTRVQQRFRGVPVWGGEAIAHLNQDGSRFAETDGLVGGINVDITPRLSSAAAIDIAVTDYGCKACLTAAPTADLWIVRDEAGADHLTYRVQMMRLDGSNDIALPVRFVDAHGGYLVLAYDNVQTGTGSSLYSGTVTITTNFYPQGPAYAMEDLPRNLGTFTEGGPYQLPSPFNLFEFTWNDLIDADDVWNAADQRAAVDAHYGIEKYLDYLSSVHGRNGVDGSGGPGALEPIGGGNPLLSQFVHYGNNYNNASFLSLVFQDGSPAGGVMIYGDGDGSLFSPLVTIDIAGHEITHALTRYTANLVYQNESGALNESWSDVFGALLERYVRGESANTWLIGEEAFTPAFGGDALRSMNDPHLAGNGGYTANDDPDHYSERYTGALDNGGVHINSGIANKAFYLLAKGGTHHLGGSMTGIGADQAAQIWFTALMSYMTSGTDFAGARAATSLAATALYGAGSTQQKAVDRAWCLVGVGSCVAVEAISVSPSSGTGATQTFTLQYSDTQGGGDLVNARVRFGASNVGPATCTAWYNAVANTISILDDAGSTWTAGTLGSGTLSNSQCTLNLGSSSRTINGENLTVVLNITFTPAFGGAKNIYMLAGSNTAPNPSTGWLPKGTWTVPSSPTVTVDAVSVTPNSGSGATQSFSLVYSDSAGATDLSSARVRFATSSGQGAGTCSAWYDATTSTIKLMDDGGAWGSGVSIGSGTLSNSQCTLNLGSSSATPSSNTLTLVLNITFNASFTGQKNIYMLAASATAPNPSTGWLLKGTWTPGTGGGGPAVVNAVSVSPNSGTGATQAFTLQYSDSLGAADLSSARVRFATSSSQGAGTCTAWYDASTATIKLMSDGGAWGGAVALGSGTLSNSQCTLNLASSSATPNGNNLTLVLNITFNASFTGLKNVYTLAASNTVPNPSTGWLPKGTWTPNSVIGPAVVDAVSVSPNSGSGLSQAFTLTYSDSLGASDLSSARVRFGATNVGPGTCTAWYDAAAGNIKMMDDVGVWGSPAALGSGSLSNSQCTLNLASSTATPDGNTLTLVLSITFNANFTGLKNIYMLAASNTAPNPSTGWLQQGTWTPAAGGSAVVDAVSVAPNAGSGASQTFTFQYNDSFGATDLSSARVRFGASNVAPGTCSAWYDATTGTIKLMDDAGVWGSPVFLGSGTLSNSQCTLNLASSSANPSGTNLTLTLAISFTASFAGTKNIYMLAGSNTPPNPSTGWLTKGTWTVPASPLPGNWSGTSSQGLLMRPVRAWPAAHRLGTEASDTTREHS